MLADEVDYVSGVDTHRDQHTLAVVNAPAGAVVDETVVRATARGYADALCFVERHGCGVRAWAVEGGGHYGAVSRATSAGAARRDSRPAATPAARGARRAARAITC